MSVSLAVLVLSVLRRLGVTAIPHFVVPSEPSLLLSYHAVMLSLAARARVTDTTVFARVSLTASAQQHIHCGLPLSSGTATQIRHCHLNH